MTQEKQVAIRDNALPTSFEEIKGLADAFVKSGMFQDTKELSQAIVKIQAGLELGLPAVYSMQNINLIRNRLTTSANTIALLVKRSGRYNYHVLEHNDKSCTIVFSELEGGKWVEVGPSTWTIEDAKRAGLLKPDSGWEKYPRAMLFSRAISQGARIYCPDAIGGVYTDEEIRSIPPSVESATEEKTELIAEPSPQGVTPKKEAVKAVVSGNQQVEEKPEPDSPQAVTQPSPQEELFDWIAVNMGWKNSKAAKSWIVNKCKISEQRIQDEPEEVRKEVAELQGWK